jgi:ABC-type nitrate/sulfonate/bicarbonate transport system substrate-binding protein
MQITRKRRRLALAVPAVVAVAALAACSSGSGGSSAAGGSTAKSSGSTSVLQKLGTAPETSSLSMPATAVSAADGPLEFTVADGYFTKKGLSVTVPLSAEAQVKDAVATGSAPLDDLAGSDVLDLYAKGEGIETIGCTAASNGFYVYAKKGVTTSSLAGTSVGVPSLDGAPQFAMDYFSSTHGTDPSKLTFTPLGSIPNVLAALESGRIDVALLSTPFNLRAAADGFQSIGYAVGPPTPYVVNTSWAQKNGATITNWIEAFVQGTWAYLTDKQAAEAELAKFLDLNPANATDAKTLAASYSNYLPPVTEPLGECTAASFEPYVKYFPASEQSQLKNLSGLVDNQYVQQLWNSGFYASMQSKYGAVPGLTLKQVALDQPSIVDVNGRPAAAS